MNTLVAVLLSLATAGIISDVDGIGTSLTQEAALCEHPTLVEAWRETNALRARHNLPPLAMHAGLMVASQKHAWYMADTGVLEHGDATAHEKRALAHGFHGPVSENILRGARTVADLLRDDVEGSWMNTDANRANLLSSSFTHVGFGYALDAQGRAYWVAMFGVGSPVENVEHFAVQPQKPVRLMSDEKLAQLRELLPMVADPKVQAILDDPSLLLFTDVEMPKAYQFFTGLMPGVHLANYNISANGSEPFGNGNREFPWSSPAGTHRATNVTSFRFVHLPLDEHGRKRPIVWYRKPMGGADGYAWLFPVGTVCGEVLTMTGPDGFGYTFELRIRTRQVGNWDVDAFRPFPTSRDLLTRIQELRPDWQQRENLKTFCAHLESQAKMPVMHLVDTQPRARTFDQWMGVDTLPSLQDDKLVAELLTTTVFRSAVGEVWRTGPDGSSACAPTTLAPFHVVPANYDAGFIEVDEVSCMRCHDTVNSDVDKFDSGRDWYGRIRGSDGIFSFHPFAPACISPNGYGRPVQMREELNAAGLLEKLNPAKHPRGIYHRVRQILE